MGLFSFLFKKKKQEPKKEERHFIDDVSNDKNRANPCQKPRQKTKNPSLKKCSRLSKR